MSAQSLPVIQLNDHLSSNWKCDAGPVAVLNLKSTTHERIAYCWGLAANLNAIADLGIDSNDADVSNFASLISSALAPLLATLYNLGDETFKADNGADSCSMNAPVTPAKI